MATHIELVSIHEKAIFRQLTDWRFTLLPVSYDQGFGQEEAQHELTANCNRPYHQPSSPS